MCKPTDSASPLGTYSVTKQIPGIKFLFSADNPMEGVLYFPIGSHSVVLVWP